MTLVKFNYNRHYFFHYRAMARECVPFYEIYTLYIKILYTQISMSQSQQYIRILHIRFKKVDLLDRVLLLKLIQKIMQCPKNPLNIIFAIGAILTALYAIFAYGILSEWLIPLGMAVHQNMRRQFKLQKPAIYIHALSSAIALAIGPFQVIAYFRSKYLEAHRWAGRTYVLFAIFGSVTSIIVAQKAQGGIAGVVSFTILGVLWLISTLIGFIGIAFFKNIWVHELSMQISVALSYSAVSIRILLPIAVVTDFQIGYAIVSWLSWTINLLVLFIVRKKSKVDSINQSQEQLQK